VKKATIIIVVFLLLLGGRYYFVYKNILGSDILFFSQKVSFEGFVDEDPSVRDTNQRIIVTVTSDESSIRGKRVVFSVPKFPVYQYGTKLQVSGNLEQPKNFTTEKGEFNYRAYLAAKDIMYVINRPKVLYIGDEGGNLVVRKLLACKKLFVRNLELVLGEPHASLAAGLLVGEKHSLSRELLDEFRRVGLTHIIVLSGYNIAIVVQTIGSMLVWLPRRIRIILSAVSVVLFCVLVGGGATVVRAAAMALLVLLARATGRTATMARMLALAAGVMVAINPRILLHDPSFQLSFLASLGLILVAPIIEQRLGFLEKYPKIKEIVVATIATQVLVLPLLLYQTGLFSFVALPANLLVLPFVPLAMLLGLFAGIVSALLSPLALIGGFPVYAVLAYILSIVELFAELPFASTTIGAFPLWMLLISYALIGIMIWKSRRPRPIKKSEPN